MNVSMKPLPGNRRIPGLIRRVSMTSSKIYPLVEKAARQELAGAQRQAPVLSGSGRMKSGLHLWPGQVPVSYFVATPAKRSYTRRSQRRRAKRMGWNTVGFRYPWMQEWMPPTAYKHKTGKWRFFQDPLEKIWPITVQQIRAALLAPWRGR